MQGLTNGKHAKKMVYSRYAKFLKSVANNRRPALCGLLRAVKDDCQSYVGQNIRAILLDSEVRIVPGETTPRAVLMSALGVVEEPKNFLTFQLSYQNKTCSEC